MAELDHDISFDMHYPSPTRSSFPEIKETDHSQGDLIEEIIFGSNHFKRLLRRRDKVESDVCSFHVEHFDIENSLFNIRNLNRRIRYALEELADSKIIERISDSCGNLPSFSKALELWDSAQSIHDVSLSEYENALRVEKARNSLASECLLSWSRKCVSKTKLSHGKFCNFMKFSGWLKKIG